MKRFGLSLSVSRNQKSESKIKNPCPRTNQDEASLTARGPRSTASPYRVFYSRFSIFYRCSIRQSKVKNQKSFPPSCPLASLSHLFGPIFLPPLLSAICAPCIKIRAHPVPSVVNSH